MTSHALFEDFTFLNNSDFDIVVLAPQILVMVLNECEVMAAFRTAIVDTYSVQIVGLVLQIFKNLSQVIILMLNLRLKRFNLFFGLVCILLKVWY